MIFTCFGVDYYLIPMRPGWRGGGQYKLPGPSRTETGPGAKYVAYVLVVLDSIIICRLYRLTLSDQAQVTLQPTVFPI
jgi:hypothetical protein